MTDIRAFNLEEELASYEDVFGEAVSQESLSNLKNLGLAVQMFLADNDGVMPDMMDPHTHRSVADAVKHAAKSA